MIGVLNTVERLLPLLQELWKPESKHAATMVICLYNAASSYLPWAPIFIVAHEKVTLFCNGSSQVVWAIVDRFVVQFCAMACDQEMGPKGDCLAVLAWLFSTKSPTIEFPEVLLKALRTIADSSSS